MASYHGPTPVTDDDKKMAKKHLKETQDVVEDKIDDHKKALKEAIKSRNQKSADYNRAHLVGHEKENDKIEKSLDTLKHLDPDDNTYDDVRKKKVAIMNKKAEA
jgi:predicted Zn-dependent protease